MNKLAILDRDNTLNIDHGHTHRAEDLVWLDGALSGLKKLHDLGYKLVVITNQAGVAKGLYSENDVHIFHHRMNSHLESKYGFGIEKFYFCPHHPEASIQEYAKKCECRKPGNRLYREALSTFQASPVETIVIGDKISDILPALTAGIKRGFIIDLEGGKDLRELDQEFNLKIVNGWSRINQILENEFEY